MYIYLALLIGSAICAIASLIGFAAPAVVIPAGLGVVVFGVYYALAWWERRSHAPKKPEKWIVVDGSNVMYWKDGKPKIDPITEVVEKLEKLGFTPGVMFDANAGYLLTGKYEHHGAMSRLLKLPQDRVMVAPKGTQADEMILPVARDLGARIVTNDKFQEWREQYPEVSKPGHLIQGAYQNGSLKLYSSA